MVDNILYSTAMSKEYLGKHMEAGGLGASSLGKVNQVICRVGRGNLVGAQARQQHLHLGLLMGLFPLCGQALFCVRKIKECCFWMSLPRQRAQVLSLRMLVRTENSARLWRMNITERKEI